MNSNNTRTSSAIAQRFAAAGTAAALLAGVGMVLLVGFVEPASGSDGRARLPEETAASPPSTDSPVLTPHRTETSPADTSEHGQKPRSNESERTSTTALPEAIVIAGILLLTPVLVAAAGLIPTRPSRARIVRGAATAILAGWVLLFGFSGGPLYAPAALLLAASTANT